MIKRSEVKRHQERAAAMLDEADIAITPEERANIEIVEHGLQEFEKTGVSIVVYENNEYYCAKELVLFPRQTCPEHRHPAGEHYHGKVETFRCRRGVVYLYIPGEPVATPKAIVPAGNEAYYTAFHEIVLLPGEQYTIPENTLHWFQAGDEGAIVSEFSTTSRDESDVFTDPRIERTTEIIED